ncbi:hypothetical protein J6X13_02125 [Candidatus Saccharibacteria bacterium]|nr:hypothetical protein [Candidatus Saccharibacteria bacterium]
MAKNFLDKAKELFGGDQKLHFEPKDNISRDCPSDYRQTITSVAKDIRSFLGTYLDEPNNGLTGEELSVYVKISGDNKTLYSLTVLRKRQNMSTDNTVYKNSYVQTLGRGKNSFSFKISVAIFIKNRNKRGIDRSADLYRKLEKFLEVKHKW